MTRPAQTNKTAAIRDVLKSGGAFTLEQLSSQVEAKLKSIIGRKKIRDLLAHLKSKGEVMIKGRHPKQTFALLTAEPPAAKKRGPYKKHDAAPVTLPEIARKYTSNGDAHQQHVLTTLEALVSVLDTEGTPETVLAALKSHREAIELAQG